MSNTTETKRPTTATMRGTLTRSKKFTKDEAAALSPAQLLNEYNALKADKPAAQPKAEKPSVKVQPKADKPAPSKKEEPKAEKAEKKPVEKKVAPFSTNTTKRGLVAMATAPVPSTPEEFKAAVEAGTVTFSKVRENGSLRHWPVAAPGTKVTDQTEKVCRAMAVKGATVSNVAKELGMSVPTVRRALITAKFTEEVFNMKAAEVKALAKALNS